MNNVQKLCEKHCDLEASTEKMNWAEMTFFAYVTNGRITL